MRVIEITENKVDNMSSLVEDMLLSGGKLMSCLERLSEEMHGERYAERNPRYGDMEGDRMGWDRMDERRHDMDRDMMGERRYTRRMR